jgi:DNA primase
MMKIIQQEKIVENIEQILDEFGIDYKKHNNRLSFACPIHDGSKKDGATIYTNGNGIWKCWTSHCEIHIGKSIFNLVKALLEKYNGISSLDNSIEWLEKFLKQELTEENTEYNTAKRSSINLSLNINHTKNQQEEQLITRRDVIQSLQIPSKYFIDRGFQQNTLLKYDVGLCTKSKKQMYNRVVAPVYDDEYKYMVGCIGRTQKPMCQLCRKFHFKNEICPISSIDEYYSSKWINSTGFNGENYLYNYWFAKDFINKSNAVILVEGAGDIWRLEEAGIKIGLGLFGAHLTDKQSQRLEKLSVINLIIATDNDDAGKQARALIKEKLWRHYNIYDVIVEGKDVGDCSVEQIHTSFNPILEKLRVI